MARDQVTSAVHRARTIVRLAAIIAAASSAGCATSDALLYGDPAAHVVLVRDRFGGGDSIKVDLGDIQLTTNARTTKLNARRDGQSNEIWLTMEIDPLSSTSLLYARCHSFDLVADGRSVPHGEVRYATDIQHTWPHETVAVPIPVDEARKLVAVTSIEGRICKDEFSLWRVPLARWKAFAQQLR